MAQSLSKIYVHTVFSTKGREPSIPEDAQERLWAFLAGALKNLDSHALRIGGTTGHVHALHVLPRTRSISELVREMKKASARWAKQEGVVSALEWQDGYGAFSVSQSDVKRVTSYIENQEEHHLRRSFQDEFKALLEKYEIDYDERYLWV